MRKLRSLTAVSRSGVVMAAAALGVVAMYLLLSQTSKFAVESSFQESRIVPDVISTAPSTAAEVHVYRSI